MRILTLFAGTKSISKVYPYGHDIRTLDIDNNFKPYYNVDILSWDYKTELKDWIPDYIHSSPVCKEFTKTKNGMNNRNIDIGLRLLNKSLEIIEYVKQINPKLKFTIENPVGIMRRLEVMKQYKRITTSYCMYGFSYNKPTDFWYGGFELKLRHQCRNTVNPLYWCDNKKEWGRHRVIIGLWKNSKTYDIGKDQIPCYEHFTELRKEDPKYKGYSNTEMRYRIPKKLCEDIKNCVLENKLNI